MKIDKTLHDEYAILTLKGEFDTFYVPSLQEEVDGLLDRGITHLILNMRLVKFINSTALGGIIKIHKLCKAEGGTLVIAKPSAFVRDIVGKVGIDQLVKVFAEEEEAVKHLIKELNTKEFSQDAPVNQEKILIAFPDETRNQQIGGKRTLVGTMCNVNGECLQFQFDGAKIGMNADQAKQLFFSGSEAYLKFQVKMFKKGYFEVLGKVEKVENSGDEVIKVSCSYASVTEDDRIALAQFADDMAFLKRQLPTSEGN